MLETSAGRPQKRSVESVRLGETIEDEDTVRHEKKEKGWERLQKGEQSSGSA
jgi:hypothetical protein